MSKQAKRQMGGSGETLPAGSIGEVIAFTTRTTTGSAGTWVANTTKLATLTPGVWSIRAVMEHSTNNTASLVYGAVSSNSAANVTGLLAYSKTNYTQSTTASEGFFLPLAELDLVYITSGTQDLYAKSFSEDAAVNVSIKGFAVRIA